MNKFGLLEEEAESSRQPGALTDKLAAFATVKPRARIDMAAIDEAASHHGFVSREASEVETRGQGRRRRAVPSEPTRHLAIRLTTSAYDRFVAFADRQRLTYHDALTNLMDQAGE